MRAEYEHLLKSADDQHKSERESLFQELAEGDKRFKALRAEIDSLKSAASHPFPHHSPSLTAMNHLADEGGCG